MYHLLLNKVSILDAGHVAGQDKGDAGEKTVEKAKSEKVPDVPYAGFLPGVSFQKEEIRGKNSTNIENKNKHDNSAIRGTLRINIT